MKDTKGAASAVQSRADADWLFSQSLAPYTGQWVAVVGRTILAHGKELEQVRTEAMQKAGPDRPLFYSVPAAMSGGA
jgi:hypothetical protein